jgi:hypothetical protein
VLARFSLLLPQFVSTTEGLFRKELRPADPARTAFCQDLRHSRFAAYDHSFLYRYRITTRSLCLLLAPRSRALCAQGDNVASRHTTPHGGDGERSQVGQRCTSFSTPRRIRGAHRSLSLSLHACAVGGAAQWVDSLSFFLLKRELPLSARAHKRAVFVPDLVLQGLPPVRFIRSLSPSSLSCAH